MSMVLPESQKPLSFPVWHMRCTPEPRDINYLRSISGCHKWHSGDRPSPRGESHYERAFEQEGNGLGSAVRNWVSLRAPARWPAAPGEKAKVHAFGGKLRHEENNPLTP